MARSDPEASSVDVWVGRQVQSQRQARGLSQTALGNAIGVSFQQVQKYERGVNRISASTLFLIARTLGVPVGALFEGLEEPPSGPAPLFDEQALDLMRNFDRIRSPTIRAKLAALVKEVAAL